MSFPWYRMPGFLNSECKYLKHCILQAFFKVILGDWVTRIFSAYSYIQDALKGIQQQRVLHIQLLQICTRGIYTLYKI